MINTQEFSKRLKKVIDYHEESASGFAESIGVQRSSISHILSGRNKPSLDFIMKVLLAYPNVDMYWLVYGKGIFPKNEVESEHQNASHANTAVAGKDTNSSKTPNLFTEATHEVSQPTTPSDASIDRIVIFYKDGRFKSYTS